MNSDNPLFILAGNGPYENRGCEAIVRGTVKIIGEQYRNPKFVCLSFFTAGERQFLNQVNTEFNDSITHLSSNLVTKEIALRNFYRRHVRDYFITRYFHKESLKYYVYKELLPYIDNASAVLSIGGDNYTIDYGDLPSLFTDLDDIVLERKKKLFLWGSSIGPFNARPEYEKYMSGHLQGVTGIFSRESVTTAYLKGIGVEDNVYSMADPAFLMDPEPPKNHRELLEIEKNSIGINFSPLMARFVCNGDLNAWRKIAASVISQIIQTTGLMVYLIPHVTTPESNDYIFMQSLLPYIDNKRDIVLIPPNINAAETKYIISRLRLFAGARTHATIAGLSSCVPTLSFAYSNKALGINLDIFDNTDYCISPDSLNTRTINATICSMLDHEGQIKDGLEEKIPTIKNSALIAGKNLRQLIEGPTTT